MKEPDLPLRCLQVVCQDRVSCSVYIQHREAWYPGRNIVDVHSGYLFLLEDGTRYRLDLAQGIKSFSCITFTSCYTDKKHQNNTVLRGSSGRFSASLKANVTQVVFERKERV